MKLTDKKVNGSEIRIYQSFMKKILMVTCCLAFAVGGYMIMKDPCTDWSMKICGGLFSMIFFGCGGLVLIIVTLYNRIRRIPFLIIYSDRLELYKQHRGVYYTIDFADVRKFRFVKNNYLQIIAIDYKKIPFERHFADASGCKKKLLRYNLNETGAIENILVSNLTMKGKDICDVLNDRLGNNFCPVCGYPLGCYEPYGNDGKTPTYDICPCCGVEWGNEDYTQESCAEYRNRWIESGAGWFDHHKKPKVWNLEKQLKNINA